MQGLANSIELKKKIKEKAAYGVHFMNGKKCKFSDFKKILI